MTAAVMDAGVQVAESEPRFRLGQVVVNWAGQLYTVIGISRMLTVVGTPLDENCGLADSGWRYQLGRPDGQRWQEWGWERESRLAIDIEAYADLLDADFWRGGA